MTIGQSIALGACIGAGIGVVVGGCVIAYYVLVKGWRW